MIWLIPVAVLCLTSCSWGPPEVDAHGVRSLIVNLITDKVSDLQSKQEKRGRVPKMKDPLLKWGPLRFRSDGRAKYRLPKPSERRRLFDRPDRVSTSLSAKLSRDRFYAELKFRF